MSPLLIALIQNLGKGIPPKKWTVSLDGQRVGPVTEGMIALNGPVFKSRFKFQENAVERTLEGEMPLMGGEESIQFDGEDVDLDDIVVSHREVFLSVRIVVEFKFTKGDKSYRYRFDGRLS